jgi:hypothetical protein
MSQETKAKHISQIWGAINRYVIHCGGDPMIEKLSVDGARERLEITADVTKAIDEFYQDQRMHGFLR